MLASQKCYQLASALSSMSLTVPYEDVQIAANYIGQCASNVLSVRRVRLRILHTL